MAARTEPELREPMQQVMQRFDAEVLAAFHQLIDTSRMSAELAPMLPSLVFAMFNGLAVGRSYGLEDQEEPVIAVIENLARLLPAIGGTP